MSYDIKRVSYALWIIQDSLLFYDRDPAFWGGRIKSYRQELPSADDPIWQTDQYRLDYIKFLGLQTALAMVE